MAYEEPDFDDVVPRDGRVRDAAAATALHGFTLCAGCPGFCVVCMLLNMLPVGGGSSMQTGSGQRRTQLCRHAQRADCTPGFGPASSLAAAKDALPNMVAPHIAGERAIDMATLCRTDDAVVHADRPS
eukprot:366417-Chlamydomonas_euryale.AAC.10